MSQRKYTIKETGPRLTSFLRNLLDRAGLEADFEVTEGEAPHPDFENPEITVKFSGADVDQFLANKAELLLALEHLAMEHLRVPSEDHSLICFDANEHRALRIEELRMSAAAAAEKVKSTGQPFFFNPMNSRERRVIHLSLRGETDLRSESTGSGPGRLVVVYPAHMPSVPSPPAPPMVRGGPPSGRGPMGGRGGPGRFGDRPRERPGDRRQDRYRGDRPRGRH